MLTQGCRKGEISGNMLDEIKRKEGEKKKGAERGGKGGGGLLQMLGRDLGDFPRLSLSLMQIIRPHN